jgi:hypothetical protein
LKAVKRFRLAIVFALLALWMPAVLHCRLEKLPGFSALFSCPHSDAAPSQEQDCGDQLCPSIESGDYRTPDDHLEIAVVDAIQPDVPAGSFAVGRPESAVAVDCPPLSPPELVPSWSFVRRAAASPRAPSPVS